MKNLSKQMLGRLRRGVTTLCTCMTIRRRDGKVLTFTDHDQPVDVAGTLFLPYHSFSRTSVSSTLELDVDGLELIGILNSTAVSREDIAAGDFDGADVEVFVVDYEMPEIGKVILRIGTIGEIVANEDGTFEAEVRGLSQVYTFRIGESYTPECRANLGDRRCKVPIEPPRWRPGTAYRRGDAVKGIVNPASNYENLGFTNGSFEDSDVNEPLRSIPGWKTYGSVNGRWEPRTTLDDLNGAISGSYFIAHRNPSGDSADLGLTQTLYFQGQGVDQTAIDTGLSRLTSSVWMGCTNRDAKGRFRVSAIINGVADAVIYDSGVKVGPVDQWFVENGCKDVIIPMGTIGLKFDIYATKKANDETGMCFDFVQAAVNYPNGNYGGNDQFGDVVFRAQSSGTTGATEPDFSNLIGSEVNDNGIVWAAQQAWTRTATVEAPAVDNRSFLAEGITQPPGYYDGGLLTWETGSNAGHSQEVKSWKGGSVVFFQRPYHAMRSGDRYTIRPGCDKRRTTCVEKFSNILNFRGEPDVPGQDEYYKTPNATAEA
ncbi:hypothetical protein BAJUN_02800 [Bajunvirus bajun]|uniref:Bacteriophage phiJL001 Gp84 C-terminal domain-containing protein n=1 Tax=Brevundimonas phage vB_BgoS-Bajun TaxID=2948594 RepID=A0A9E7STE9_9CAUD|nr:hypothetical protein BAJUN_02800 [Brevundimonas phage vB_BgoS-Bajun]